MRDKIFSKVALGVCGAIGSLSDMKVPDIVLKPVIAAYSLGFRVNQSDANVPQEGFSCFGDFFARSLKEGARVVSADADAFVSPCDGTIASIQPVHEDAQDTFLVKGYKYNISQLLGIAPSDSFAGGEGMVIYLHPRDYHRVHVPVDANLLSVRHIAGARFPVAPWAEKRVDGIYQRNERMVFHFQVGAGSLVLVMVAAFGVGNIATPYAPPKGTHTSSVRLFDSPPKLKRGDELGAFRLGSTVVMFWSPQLLSLSPSTAIGKVVFGEKLGVLTRN